MNAILFPGQGSQIVGMGSEFYNNFAIVKKIFKEADDKLNYKISQIILEGPDDKFKDVKTEGVCEIANDNAEGQTIISGDIDSVNYLQNILKEKKRKFIPLNVSAPFHCSLMAPAANKMKEKIYSISFKKPIVDIVCNVTSKPENKPENIKKLLIDQICSTVRWRESIINMSKENITSFIEIGPGKVLSGMVKRTVKNINCFSINSISDMKKTVDELKK